MSPPRLLLASKSEARRRMLEAAGVPFGTVDAELDEEEAKAGLVATGFEPRDLAEMLAEIKRLDTGVRPKLRATLTPLNVHTAKAS